MKPTVDKMWCLVSQPNSVILEVELDSKARGQECLEKVCETLGISKESDYFGLKFTSAKGEELWLNLRNPVERQVQGVHPYRFALRVKFWVPPHLLLQETTRHQFFLHARLDLLSGRLKVHDWPAIARLAALVTQAELGDHDPASTAQAGYVQQCCQLVASRENKPDDLNWRIVGHHKEMQGMKPSTAEYWLLKEVSGWDNFGQEMFPAKTTVPPAAGGAPGAGAAECLGVGPHGLTLYPPAGGGGERRSIPYTAIQSASSHRRTFHLAYLGQDRDELELDLKLDSSQAASGLYRAITEKHAFYSCETVRSAVTAQFIRDLKGTIVSIFNVDTSFGKKYVFDIRRTCREVYDNARRALYQTAAAGCPAPEEGGGGAPGACDWAGGGGGGGCSRGQCKSTSQRLLQVQDAMACRVCMDRPIDTAFFPCGHAMTCGECAARCLDRCPLCRSEVAERHRIYLPLELQRAADRAVVVAAAVPQGVDT